MTPVIHVRPLTASDLPLGLRLTRQAGWNQTEADWQRFRDLQPDGCFVAELDGLAVGTVTTCILGTTGWVAMVLVDQASRGRGAGRALMEHALAFLERQQVRSARLDATPLGRPLYEKLGFAEEYTLLRYEGVLPPAGAPAAGPEGAGVTAARPDHLGDLLRLDREVTATDRGKLLRRLFAERPDVWRVLGQAGRVVGYLAGRVGARALLIGPCLATPGAGPPLLADAWRRHAGERVFIDIPAGNEGARACAEAVGLTVQRPLVRMCRGPRAGEDSTRLWASSGPEKG
jgi:GNAT superfamily N-acetyltransferase